MGKINTTNYPNRPVSSYQDDDMFILQDNGGETYTTNVSDIKNLIDNKIKLEGVKVDGSELPITNKKVNVDLSGKADLTVIASPFNDNLVYFKGAYVTYNGRLYEFTQQHTGAWDATHAREKTAVKMFVRAGNGGYNTGNNSTTEGSWTRAEGEASHAEGLGTIANSDNQHAEGKYNIADTDDEYALIVGNGTADNARSNAMTLDWDGNLVVSGDVEDGNGEKISDKSDKVSDAVEDNFAMLTDDGDLADSGHSDADYVHKTGDETISGDKTFTGIVESENITEIENAMSSMIKTTPAGNPVVIETEYAQNAKGVEVEIEPQQDLHGYDKPWAGGAGKNKVNFVRANVEHGSEVTFTDSGSGPVADFTGLPSGTYTFTNLSGNTCYLMTSASDYSNAVVIGNSYTVNYDGSSYLKAQYSNFSGNTTFKAQMELGSTATAYEPYSNICPISGYDEVEIKCEGKNLLNKNTITNGYRVIITNGNLENAGGGFFVTDYISVKGGETYTNNFSYHSSGNYGMAFYDANKQFISGQKQGTQGATVFTPFTFTVPQNAHYVRLTGNKNDAENYLDLIQCEYGSQATAYAPYQAPNTATIDLPQTVYGGVLKDGNLKDTHKYIDLASLSWTQAGVFFQAAVNDIKNPASLLTTISMFAENYNPVARNRADNEGDICVQDSFVKVRTQTSPTGHFCYELTTSIDIPINPTQLPLLEGTNVITVNGKTIKVTYRDGVVATLDDVATKADEAYLATVESGTKASKAYSVNDFMVRPDGFYKVTANIASGASITSSNTTKVTVGEILTALLNA